MHTIVLFHSITCIKPCDLLPCVILSLPCPYVIPSCPHLEKDLSSFPFGPLPSWLLPSSLFLLPPSSLPFLPLSPPLNPLLLFILPSYSSHRISSLFILFFPLHQSPIYHLQASHLCSYSPSVLDIDSTLSTIYLIDSLPSFLPHLIESYPLPCLSVASLLHFHCFVTRSLEAK